MKPHLCHIFPSFGTGGPEVRTAVLVNATRDRFRHTIVSISGNLAGRERVEKTDDVQFLASPPRRRLGGHVRALSGLLAELHPDLVLTYGWGGVDGILAARIRGMRRIIHAEDGFLPDEAHRQKLRRLLARRLFLRAARCVVCPSHTLEAIAQRLWWLPAPKIVYIPNGVDIERYRPARPDERERLRQQFGLASHEVVIGTVGHLRAEKNQERLLRAFATLADQPLRLVFAGDGPLRSRLETLAAELGFAKKVTFAGDVRDPADHYRALDVFALSSDTEQMPIAALEAMSTALPVVSTDVGDVKRMVSAENVPYVVPPSNDAGYAGALRDLVEKPGLRAALGRANRARCERDFGLAGMVAAYVRLYEDVLGKTPS